MAERFTLGLIGGGNMAEAIVRAAIDNELIIPGHIIMSDPVPERRALFADMGVKAVEENAAVVSDADHVMLAIKPQTLPDIAGDLQGINPEKQIIISIMAGITTHRIEQAIGKPSRIIRVMPNTPLLVGLGMSAIALGENAHMGDEVLAMGIFDAAGEAVVLDEEYLDAVTAVSGSGPAYVFFLAEAMTEGARAAGLSGNIPELLTRQTILGAAQLLKDSEDSAKTLRERVTSPGGTTEAAIKHLGKAKTRAAIVAAIQRATDRSRELGK